MSFSTYFSEQARKPSGPFGRIVMPVVFDRGNAFLNGLVNSLIAVQPNDRVLEIGCGTGKLVDIMAKNMDKGIISGIDFSSTMVKIAQKRNKKKASPVGQLILFKQILMIFYFQKEVFQRSAV